MEIGHEIADKKNMTVTSFVNPGPPVPIQPPALPVKPPQLTAVDPAQVTPSSGSGPSGPLQAVGVWTSAPDAAGGAPIKPPQLVVNDQAQVSPSSQLFSLLQQSQSQNPAQFQQITSQLATGLQADAKSAHANGNSGESALLTQLANLFGNASKSGQLSSGELQSILGGRHGHHHHHHGGASTTSSVQNDLNSIAQNILSGLGTVSNSNTTAQA